MALLFVGGVMNLLWIAALTLLVAMEKLAPKGEILAKALGAAHDRRRRRALDLAGVVAADRRAAALRIRRSRPEEHELGARVSARAKR